MGIIEKGLELVFPSNIYCISCGSIIDGTRPYALCDECMEKFHWLGQKTCDKCGKILKDDDWRNLCYDCRTYTHEFTKGYTCVQYGLYERGLLMDYKYRDKSYIGKKLGDILYDRMALEAQEFDLIVPVPMYEKKRRQRGYNQAEVMAARFAQRRELPYGPGLLKRSRETLPMKGLGAFERQENLRDAFEVSSANHYEIENKRILLIDDIYTTGSTMDACSKALREAGVREIYVLSFACGANIPPKN